MTRVQIRSAVAEDVPALARVLSEAAVHKRGQGDNLWGTRPFTEAEVLDRLAAGGLYAVLADSEVVATASITETDERMWGDEGLDPDYALYIHKLATGDAIRGKRIGGQILELIAEKAIREHRGALRLDCSYTNSKLYNYYTRHGFKEVSRRDIPSDGVARNPERPVYKAALLQRDV